MAAGALRKRIHFVVVVILLRSSLLLSAGSAVNIATSATCTASCQPDGVTCTECQLAINGKMYSGEWRYTGATVGGWLQIEFDKTYDVSSLFIVLPFYQENRQFKDIKLTFYDGSEQMITLTNQPDGWVEENVTIIPPRPSSSVKLSVVSAYDDSKRTNIMNEVEVYGTIPDESTTVKIHTTTATTSSVPLTETTTTPPTTSTTPPTTSTTPRTTSTTPLTTSTTPPTTSTMPPMTLTTPSTTSTTPPTTSTTSPNEKDTLTTMTDTSVSEALTAVDTNVTVDADPARMKKLWTRSRLYIVVGVVAALLILVVCSTVSRKGEQSTGEEDMYDTIS